MPPLSQLSGAGEFELPLAEHSLAGVGHQLVLGQRWLKTPCPENSGRTLKLVQGFPKRGSEPVSGHLLLLAQSFNSNSLSQ